MFNTNLRLGAVSTDVQNLQKLLNMDAATKVASTGAGSMGYETLRFGPATLAAVKKFQAANGISPVSGYVGPLTRAALNTICTGNGNTTTTNH
jgi:peptidoglycan hydrolase-like protein with peptidoglycan-binding domain